MSRPGWSRWARVVAVAAVLFVVATCATSGGDKATARPPTCAGGVCARVVKAAVSFRLTVEVIAPPRTVLHNAWLVDGAGAACRGGRALNAVQTDAGLALHGPLPLEGTRRLSLAFEVAIGAGSWLDLDVRSPEGNVCLRLPLGAAARADAGTDGARE